MDTIVNMALINITPERGYPAEFAVFDPKLSRPAFLYASIGPAPGYAPRLIAAPLNRSDFIEQVGAISTFFGDPVLTDGTSLSPSAFLTNPSDCSAPAFTSSIHMDSWENPATFNADGSPNLSDPNWKSASSVFSGPVTGCEKLRFPATMTAAPTTAAPDSPSGLNVDLQVPQNEDPNGLATPPLKDVDVALPAGLISAPSLRPVCRAAPMNSSLSPPRCLRAVRRLPQIGEVTVHTPVLGEPVQGQVFLGSPLCDPCSAADAAGGRMVRLFIQLHSDRYGVTIKSPGTVTVNQATGQLTASFQNLPQQPFSDLRFNFKEGPRAPLVTPVSCGTFTTAASLAPWSAPYTPTVSSPSSFNITGCGSSPFTPGVHRRHHPAELPGSTARSRSRSPARTANRPSPGLEQTLPPGLSAKLAGVRRMRPMPKTNAARANTGECPASSRIGSVTVAAGPGSKPFYKTGSAYLTGPYNGGPFGMAVICPRRSGPVQSR